MGIIDPNQALRFRAVEAGSAAETALAARQNPVVTQTITRPYTTITAVVTLGPGDRTSTTAAQTTIPTAVAPPSTSSTSATVSIPGAPNTSSSSLTQGQLGAILGSVLGSVLVVALIWYCVNQRRRRDEARYLAYIMSGESVTSTETAEVTMTGGGGNAGAWQARRMAAAATGDPWVRSEVISVVPPPPRFPPTPRYTPYRQTRNPQIRGVKRYP